MALAGQVERARASGNLLRLRNWEFQLHIKKCTCGALALTSAILALALGHGAHADSEEEKKKLAQCARDICIIIISKNPKGPDLSCDLTKTWDEAQIQKGADSKNIMWGLGSVRCSVKFNIKRADIVAALAGPETTFKAGKQSIACEIGAGQYPISATLSPELEFKSGTNTAASLRMDDIEGAILIKGVVWTAAQLERHFGIFEGDLVREVNRFVQKECPKFVRGAK